MKRILLTLFTVMLMASSAAAIGVTEITLRHSNDQTIATIVADDAVRFTHQTVESKDGKPERLLVDLIGAVHELQQKTFGDLPHCAVEKIRTSQFAVNPEPVVRIVFDMRQAPVYTVSPSNNQVVVTIEDENAQLFASWSSSQSQPAPKPAVKPTAKPASTTSAAPVTPKADPKPTTASLEKARQESLVPAAPLPEPQSTASAWTQAMNKANAAAGNPTPVKLSDPDKDKPLPAVSKPQSKPASPVVTKPAPVVNPPAPPLPAQPRVNRPDTAIEPVSAEALTPAAPQAVMGDEFIGPQAPTLPVAPPVVASTTPVVPPRPTAAAASQTKSQPVPVVVEKPAEPKKKSTSRFRRDAASLKLKGTMVAEFPKRLVIKYSASRRKDPFATLIDATKAFNSPMEQKVPNVEGLTLVGILESTDLEENRALLEDKDGYSYILKSGDKVRNGYVLRVDREKIYFQIFEYGWSRTLALQIEEQF